MSRQGTLSRVPALRLSGPVHRFARYGVVPVAVGATFGLKLLLDFGADQTVSPFLLVPLGILVSAWFGWGPGLLATLLSALLTELLFSTPEGSLFTGSGAGLLQLVAFAGEGCTITAVGYLAGAAYRSREQLLEQERAARARVEAVTDRLRFLAEASQRLSGSLDYLAVLREFGAILVPALADWCAVDAIDDDEETVQRLVVTHADPAKGEIARLLEERVVRHTSEVSLLVERLRRGEAVLNPSLTEADLVASARDAKHLEIMRELGFMSAMIVPILTRERLIGAVTLVTAAESGRRYDETDLAFVEELAKRAAVAVENARLYTMSQAAQVELRKAGEAKDEFLGLISHELRTPVTIIYGASHLLRSRAGALDERSKGELMSDIESESDRLRRLIEDMLVLARLELNQPTRGREPVHVEHAIAGVVQEIIHRSPLSVVHVQVEPELPPVAAEPTYVSQILRNLLINAIKYGRTDQPIDISAVRNGGADAVISVKDRGRGVRPEELETIFDRFYRSNEAGEIGGAGMGLTVCKRLVQAQSGKIWAELREGGGLAINFSLPLYSDDAN